MKSLVFVLLVMVIMVSLLCFLIYFLPSRSPDGQKVSPYECGFDPLNSARVPFSFRFFLVAILFLLFDLEMALLFPLPYSISSLAGQDFILFLSLFFLYLLTVGLIYEWMKGGLDWAD